jgi:hypothetical protein
VGACNYKVPTTNLSGAKTLPKGIVRQASFAKRASLPSGFFTENPWVSGFAVFERWGDLEPQEGQFDFSYLDCQAEAAETLGKPVIFIVESAFDGTTMYGPPGWLFTAPNDRPYVTLSDGTHCLVPWDPVVNDAFLVAAKAIAARYDNDPNVVGIYVAGTQSNYPEMFYPFPAKSFWTKSTVSPPNGISPDLPFVSPAGSVYSDAWNTVLKGMGAAFAHTWLVNMIDEVADPSGSATLLGPLEAVSTQADSMNLSAAGHATLGITNLGWSTVVQVPPSAKYTMVTAANHPSTPIVYELGPLKQDGGAGEVYSSLEYAATTVKARTMITQPATWGDPPNNPHYNAAYIDEMKKAQMDFWP